MYCFGSFASTVKWAFAQSQTLARKVNVPVERRTPGFARGFVFFSSNSHASPLISSLPLFDTCAPPRQRGHLETQGT